MQTLLHMALGNAVAAAAMALLLLPAARWLKRPALTHALSLLILLKLVTPPLVDLPMMWPAPAAAGTAQQTSGPAQPLPLPADQALDRSQMTEIVVAAAPEAATALPPAPVRRAPDTSPLSAGHVLRWAIGSWAAAAWVGSSALYAAVVLLRIVKLRRAVRRAIVPGEDLTQEVSRLARQMGLAVAPQVRFVSGVAPPMLLALFGKPCVLVPAALWSRLDDPKRQTLLLHELAHLRRRDHWVRYLELAASCAYWWHPAVWWARSALREAEEQCCDAWVIWAMPAARRTYMTTLLDAVDFISESVRPNSLAAPVLASGMGQFQHLQRRLTMVRERSVQRRLSGGGLVAVVLSAIALPLGPRLLRADDAPPTSGRQPPAVDERPAADPDGADRDPRATRRQQAPATDSTRSPQASSGDAPTPRYERSGMSQVESLDAQLKAARMQIEALEKELAATKAASPVPIATRVDPTAAKPETPVRVLVLDPSAAVPPNPPAPASKIIIQYGNGKLEAIAIPGQKTIWTNNIGPIGALESVAGKIIVHGADGKAFEIAVGDGRVLAETPAASATGNVGVMTGVAPPVAVVVPEPGMRGPTTPAATEERLDAIERKLNALIEAVDRRAKLDAERAAQGDRARNAVQDPNQWQDGKAGSDARPRRESAPDALTPPDAVRRGREWTTPAPSPVMPPRRESAPEAPAGPTDSIPPATPSRRESPPSDATPPQPESTPAVR